MIIPGGVTSSSMGPLAPRGGWMSSPLHHWDRSRISRRRGSEQIGIFDVFLILASAGTIARFMPVLARFPLEEAAVRGFTVVSRPVNWALYNVYREIGDLTHWMKGGKMGWGTSITARPYLLPTGVPIMVPFPWIDFKAIKDTSSGGGGPGDLPSFHRPPPSIEETGEILSNPPMAGGKTGSPRRSTSKKAGQCPYYLREIRAGRKYWQKGRVFRGRGGKSYDISKHDRCAKRAGHSGRHSFSGPFHSKGNITSYLKRLHG